MVESMTPDIVDSWLVVKAVKTTELDEIQWGMFPFWPEAYASLGTVTLQSSPHRSRSTAIMTTIAFVITARMMTYHLRHQHAIILLSLHHSCVLLFCDHAITILMILMTHTFSYLSLTLPGLSLDLHSFDCSSLSCFLFPLTQPAPLSL